MAALASSAVTINSAKLYKGLGGVEERVLNVSLALTGQGDATDSIDASTLGLTKFTSCSNFIKSDNTIIFTAAISADGSKLLLAKSKTDTSGTDAPTTDTGITIIGEVRGY